MQEKKSGTVVATISRLYDGLDRLTCEANVASITTCPTATTANWIAYTDVSVRLANSQRASDVLPTQGDAIARARELSSGTTPRVARVRTTILSDRQGLARRALWH